MPDNVTSNPGAGGAIFATDQDSGSLAHYPINKLAFGPLDTFTLVTAAAGLPVAIVGTPVVSGPLTDAQLRASGVAVTGTFFQATQPVSAVSLPLPTGAATAAKQPALGTAGAASADVISVQGAVGMTAITVTGTFWQATQPVSGTFWQATQPVSGPLTDAQLRAVAVPVSGTFWQATQPVSGTITANAGTGTLAVSNANLTALGSATIAEDAPIGAGYMLVAVATYREDAPTATTDLSGDAQPIKTDSVGRIWVNGSGVTQPVSGTFWQATQPVSGTFFQATQPVSGTVAAGTSTTGGATAYKLVSAATTNATSVKATAGTLYGVYVASVNAAARYLKLYNKAAAPVVGTDVPVMTLIIPGNTAGAGSNIPIPAQGIAFSAGIAFALTAGITDADTTAVAASELLVNLAYA